MNNARKNAILSARGTTAILVVFALIFVASCPKQPPANSPPQSYDKQQSQSDPVDPDWPRPRSDERIESRKEMVHIINRLYGLKDQEVLKAMGNVPRHWFVPSSQQRYAYADSPLPIGHNQTISQPFIVAYMTHLLELDDTKKVLEIGTGSGYQAAVLNEFTPHVYTIEIIEPLAQRAQKAFEQFGYDQISTQTGDGYKGWSEHEPFDAIIVTCAPDNIPKPLIDQLKPGGRMIIPVGSAYSTQELVLVTKDTEGNTTKKDMISVKFVPMLRKQDQ